MIIITKTEPWQTGTLKSSLLSESLCRGPEGASNMLQEGEVMLKSEMDVHCTIEGNTISGGCR